MRISYYLILILSLITEGGLAQNLDFGPSVTTDFSWVSEVGSRQEAPSGKQFSVTKYGAKSDSMVVSTKAFQKAIDACAKAGGGVVVVEPGYYQIGALFVKKGVNLHLKKGATLLASRNLKDYPEIDTRIAGVEMRWPSAVLNVIDQQNAAITGEGVIDCRGEWCWEAYWALRKDYEKRKLRWIVDYDSKRVRGILVQNSEDVVLSDFTLQRTGFWGCQVLYSSYCTLDGVIIDNNMGGHGPSTDGIDIDSSSRILVENCDVDCNDDNICLKAGRDWDGLRVNRPCEYVVIRNCIARRGAGMITCGSETSGWIRHILAYNIKAEGTNNVFRIKSAVNRGGGVEHIYVTNVEARDNNRLLVADLNWHPAYSYSTLPAEYEGKEVPSHWKTMLERVVPESKGYPRVRNIFFSHVKATNVKEFLYLAGMSPELPLENFYLYHVDIQAEKQGSITNTVNYNLQKATLNISESKK